MERKKTDKIIDEYTDLPVSRQRKYQMRHRDKWNAMIRARYTANSTKKKKTCPTCKYEFASINAHYYNFPSHRLKEVK